MENRSTSRSWRFLYLIKSAIEMIGISWLLENSSSSGRSAIVPSSETISDMTPAGESPAMVARSTAASVWPARFRTPPARARRGKTWPGLAKPLATTSSFARAWQVRARSLADIPVVVPSATSTEIVNAVPIASVLFATINGR